MHTCESIERHGKRIPGAPALVDRVSRLSWAEFADIVGRMGGVLAELGIMPGDRVALLAENSIQWIQAHYAVQWIGAIVVPINLRWTPQEICAAFQDCAPKGIVIDLAGSKLVGSLPLNAFGDATIIHIGSSCLPPGGTDLLGDARRARYVEKREIKDDAAASLFYTGGTTGRAKGVVLTHRNHVAHSISLAAELALAGGARHLHAAPMFHIADALFIHLTSLLGGLHVAIPRFEPVAFTQAVEAFEIEQTILVPTMIQMLFANKDGSPGLGRLRRLFYGASPMPQKLLQVLIAQFPQLDLIQLYGQTESSPVLTVLPPSAHRSSRAELAKSAGRALMGTEVRIVDRNDQLVPAGSHGEIVARGEQITQGYWHRREETEMALRGGWLHTGDVGCIDGEGYLFVTDRLKDMIISGGENVYSVEVEQAIYRLQGVEQCCVIGIPDERWGEAVHAIVVPLEGVQLTAEAIKLHCERELSAFKRPRGITIRSDRLPVSGAGKVLKRELRQQFQRKESACLNT